MTRFGYTTLMTEQSGPKDLVRYAVAAEEQGFDFEVSSDHYSPWLTCQGHAPYAWTVLGAVAQVTSAVELATYVTCPIIRYHPAVVAQKAATLQLLSDGRFILGLGSGENLNEHITGEGWPPIDQRQDMLVEAATIIRELQSGELVTWEGDYFRVDSARLWDAVDGGVPIAVAVSGEKSVQAVRAAGRSPGRSRTQRRVGRDVGQEKRRHGVRARSASSPSAGIPTGTRPSSVLMISSAGSPAAGRSTPTCRRRPASRVRASSCARTTSPAPFRAALIWTRSSRPSSRTGRRDSPTSPWSRSAIRVRRSSWRRPRSAAGETARLTPPHVKWGGEVVVRAVVQ